MPALASVALMMVVCAAAPQSDPADVVSALEDAVAQAIARAEPSVVSIARERTEDGDTTLAIRGVRRPSQPPSMLREHDRFGDPLPLGEVIPDEAFSFDYGSGVVIGESGQILTAYHVVKGASKLFVKWRDGKAFEAEIIAADPRSDLAVIVPRPLPGTRVPSLKPLPLGDATKLRKGSFLIALGSPFNAGKNASPSASWGILANRARRIEQTAEEDQSMIRHLRHYPTLLQLDAKLNVGMSGGAVVNLKGELVGLTTDAASPAGFDAHAGYAIPMDAMTRRAIDLLIQGKEVEYGFLGVGLNREVANQIETVQPESPAGQGDLLKGDIIVEVGDQPINDGDTLILAVNSAPVGKDVKLKVLRDGKILEKHVLVSKLAIPGGVIATNRPRPWRGLRIDFVSALPLGAYSTHLLDLMAKGGVGIAEVVPGSPAEAAGLKAGEVITQVQHKRVRTPAEFREAVAELDGPVTVEVEGKSKTIKDD
jgi:serine protease Do